MSRIKYQILIFFVFFFTLSHAQNLSDEEYLDKNRIVTLLDNAGSEENEGRYYDAIKSLNQALNVAEQIKDSTNQGIILSQLANLNYIVGETTIADHQIYKAIDIQYNIDDEVNLAYSRFVLGLIFLGKQEYNEALGYFTSATNIFQQENLNELVAEVSVSQAKSYIGLNDLDQANVYLDKAIVLSSKYDAPSIESAALHLSASIALKQNKLPKALRKVNSGFELAKSENHLKNMSEGYRILSEIHTANGNHEKANENLRAHIKLKDSILSIKYANLEPEKQAQLSLGNDDAVIEHQAEEIKEKNEATSMSRLTTILSVALITILSLLTLSLYKNNNIRLKTNNMLYKKNEELLTEKERAEIAAKTKANFLSTVTHELRTPLYAVTGLTNMLMEENPKPAQMQHLKSLKFSGDYLLTFINDILQINKIEANKVELDPEIFNLKHKTENVIAALNNQAIDNNVAIHFEYDKNLPEVFDGDQLKISQILINLIGNSIKFTKDGDIWVRVYKVSKNKSKFGIRLEVEDNGIGISKEKQQNMFESFSQGSVQINRKYGGTGLGLSIVKGLVDILKGKIYLQSELGKGTTFFVEIPLTESSKKVKEQSNTSITDKLNELDLNNVNILVVEDNKINQMITKKILTKMNLNCDIVDNGEDAVEQVKDVTYDVVLMDIHMPGISGIEATKRIRKFDKELTIFALTAVTLEDKMHEFDEAGFNDIISKPFKQEDFEKKLFAALSKGKVSA